MRIAHCILSTIGCCGHSKLRRNFTSTPTRSITFRTGAMSPTRPSPRCCGRAEPRDRFGGVDAPASQPALEAKPAALLALREDLAVWPDVGHGPSLLAGMGSSFFAADVAARRLRRHGIVAISELASVEASLPASPDLTLVAVTASGRSAETLALLHAHHGISRTIALTNDCSAATPADDVVYMRAGIETGGVACRSYLHTLVALLALEQQLSGVDLRLIERVKRSAAAIAYLLD